MKQSMKQLTAGIWRDNPAFVQLLGLCPLLAVSTSLSRGLALALATAWVMVGSSVLISATRHWIPADVRLPIYVVCIATLTTSVTLTMEAWAQPLYLALALFIQIITTNCAILGRLDQFAAHRPVTEALADSVGRAIGFGMVLVILGTGRELLAERTLGCGLDDLFGAAAAGLCVTIHEGPRVVLASTPAGAFILLGLLLALRNRLTAQSDDTQTLRDPQPLGESQESTP